MRATTFAILSLLVLLSVISSAQRTIRASTGWVKLPADGATETTAFVTVENGTMYDVYLIGVSSDVAGTVEMHQTGKAGAPAQPVKEVTIPAYDRLEMSPGGVYVHLGQLKRPLKVGDEVAVLLEIAEQPALAINAIVK